METTGQARELRGNGNVVTWKPSKETVPGSDEPCQISEIWRLQLASAFSRCRSSVTLISGVLGSVREQSLDPVLLR